MKLEKLAEDTGRWLKMMGVDDPASAQQLASGPPTAAAQPKAKEFIFKFKDEFGAGYYKIRIRTTDDGIRYNFGYFDRSDLPEIIIDPEKLTQEGRRVYEQFVLQFQQRKQDAAE